MQTAYQSAHNFWWCIQLFTANLGRTQLAALYPTSTILSLCSGSEIIELEGVVE
jgi:hypothetical protein